MKNALYNALRVGANLQRLIVMLCRSGGQGSVEQASGAEEQEGLLFYKALQTHIDNKIVEDTITNGIGIITEA